MKIRNLRTDHLENPLGYCMEKPLLTWTAEDSTGTCQRAARVQIAMDESFAGCVYDSGLRGDISSLGFVPEIELAPRTRYWWRVEVVADDGDRALSEPAWFETGKRGEAWSAKWIRAPFDADVHPILERGFELPGKPVRARIYGRRPRRLRAFAQRRPLWETRCSRRFTTTTTSGFRFRPTTSLSFCRRVQTVSMLGSATAGIAAGSDLAKRRSASMATICSCCSSCALKCPTAGRSSSAAMRTGAAAVRRSSKATSTTARSTTPGWRGLTESVPAVEAQPPVGPLSDRLSPPLRRCGRVPAKELVHTPAGELVLDFGQEMTGWVEFDCDLPEGASVTLEFGELLQRGNFYRANLRTAKARFTYISGGKPAHVRPHFTFYGFRYARVTGMADVRPEDFVGQVIHSDLAVTGKIETSNPKVNQLFHNAFWGQIGNFLDVPTDCPQRDERMGWTGDAHVFAPTASFNMYTPAFYEKYLYDMRLEQRELGGAVPHVVPDVIDQIERAKRGNPNPTSYGSCGWGDAAIGIPWTMYEFYGDREMLARQYENMKMWTDWIREQDEAHCGGRRLWTCGFHYADWLALDNPVQDSSFGGTDPYYIASAYYYSAARTTSRAAKVPRPGRGGRGVRQTRRRGARGVPEGILHADRARRRADADGHGHGAVHGPRA